MSTRFQVTTTSPSVIEEMTTRPFVRAVVPEIRIVVALAGELDLASRDIAVDSCTRDGQRHIVVDLGGVTFMDCAGYGALVSARAVLEQRGGSLTLRNQKDQPSRLLTLIDARVS